ncbi:MAG: arginine deiminase family protein, partial [Chloroflexi bacterium]|nr:arginine deiminase family protein [Chloroflexota bacterium]
MSLFGVHSEVGKLRKVLVHRPELSLQRLTPANCAELLFDDVLWVERAQLEHDQFVAVMRARGVEVFYVLDLLTETLQASQEAKRLVIEQVATEYSVGWSLVDEIRQFLWGLSPDFLAMHLIGGLTAGESGIDWGKFRKISLHAAALEEVSTFL